ncbi:MAG: chlorite dismutase family protein, partial [Chloroflexota bacterium]
MSTEQTAPTVYSNFWIYQVDRDWRDLPQETRDQQRAEFLKTIENASCVTLRGAYSTVGLRHDTDLILWVVTEDLDAMQQLAVDLN